MKFGWFLLVGIFSFVESAPQNWPYRDGLMPYRYGYVSPSQYKYLPQIEDDEEIPLSPNARQEFVVGSDGQSSYYIFQRPIHENKAWSPKWKIGDRGSPTTEATTVGGVVEHGSVAPVSEATKDPPVVSSTVATTVASAPSPRPVGGEPVGRPVQPPPFPPARPPPTPRPKPEEDEEDEDEDDDSEEIDDEEDDDESSDEYDDDEDDDELDDEESEEDEERRRQVPLDDDKPETPSPVVPSKPVDPPAPVVIEAPKNKSKDQIVDPSPSSNEVVKESELEEDSSEESGLSDGIEALVPGYVTDQGEVLVPVDTVTGDQPISIIPDPFTPITRGVPLQTSNFRYRYNPYYYSDVYSDVQTQDQTDSYDEGALSEEKDGRNEMLTAFPPSRTPELYAVINRKGGSSEVEATYKVKHVQRPSSINVPLTLPIRSTPVYNVNPFIRRTPNPFYSMMNPYAVNQYNPDPFGYQQGYSVNPFYYRKPIYSGNRYRPVRPFRPPYVSHVPYGYNPYGFGVPQRRRPQPVFIRRRPVAVHGVKLKNSQKPIIVSKPKKPVKPIVKKPTPVIYAHDEQVQHPYPFVNPHDYIPEAHELYGPVHEQPFQTGRSTRMAKLDKKKKSEKSKAKSNLYKLFKKFGKKSEKLN